MTLSKAQKCSIYCCWWWM